MYRRVVISAATTKTGPFGVVYYVRGAHVVSQRKNIRGKFDVDVPVVAQQTPNVFYDAVRLQVLGAVTANISYEFVLDVSENQPLEESVRETTSTGVAIAVYNASGVIVCHNGVAISSESAPTQTVAPGEMTSEPIDGTGEMTSEPIDGTGEMTREPIDVPAR